MINEIPAAPELRVGRLAWANRLAWEWVSGPHVREKHGVSCGHVATPVPVVIERAGDGVACADCARPVVRRELLGRATGGDYYCASCVTTARPARDFRPADARAEQEFLAARNQPRAPKPVAKPVRPAVQTAAAKATAKPRAQKARRGRAA
jgi:hypothetical protein